MQQCGALGVYGRVHRDKWIRKHCTRGHYGMWRSYGCVACKRENTLRWRWARYLMAYWAGAELVQQIADHSADLL